MAPNEPGDGGSTPTSGAPPPAKAPPSEKEIARKLRKRELDRRAQRQARERTRNRIAELEAQVKELRKDDSTRLSACMEQLATVTRDRDRLAETLKVIEQTIRDNVVPSRPAPAPQQPSTSTTTTSGSLSDARDVSSSSMLAACLPPAGPQPPHSSSYGPIGNTTLVPETPSALDVYAFSGHGMFGAVPGVLPSSSVHAPSVHAPSSTSESQDPADDACANDFVDDDAMMMDEDPDDPSLIVPPPELPCDCVTVRTPGPSAPQPQVNVWRAVNQVLAKRCRISREAHVAEDASDEDIPVRVLLEGWDAVARTRPLSRLWKKLRRVDELCFQTCPKTERLAILRTMHLLLQYHSDPIPSRYAKLPTWYLKRPSQAMPHSYAIDFFVWPGVRERFVFGQHHYCNNSFWALFGPNFHLLWPYEFRDAYKKSVVTGQYQISPMFEQRISDINSWTMGMDFFTRFPELIADIPAFHSVAQAPTPPAMSTAPVTSPPIPQQASLSQLKERDERMLLEQQQQQQQQLQQAAEDANHAQAQDAVIDCTQAMQVYPPGIYSMAAPFMEDFIPQGYDAAAGTFTPLGGYF